MKTSDLISPCKDCPDRHRACHDSCERYKHYKQCREELKRYTREMNAIEGIEIARVERIKRNARRKFGGENQ